LLFAIPIVQTRIVFHRHNLKRNVGSLKHFCGSHRFFHTPSHTKEVMRDKPRFLWINKVGSIDFARVDAMILE